MKKLLAVFAVLCLVMSACATSTEPEASEDPKEKADEQYTVFNSFLGQGFFTKEFAIYHDNHGLLRLFDVASKTDIVYCFDPGCEHEMEVRSRDGSVLQEGCSAYKYSSYPVMLKGEECFFFDQGTRNVIRSDRQGGNRKVIGTIPQYLLPYNVFFSKDSIFVTYVNSYEMIETKDKNGETLWIVGDPKPKNTCGIVMINLETGQYRELQETEEYSAQIIEYDVRGDHLYYQLSYMDIPYISPNLETADPSLIPEGMTVENYWEELQKHGWMDIYDYTISTGDLRMVMQHQHYDSTVFCKDFFAVAEGNVTGLYRYSGERFRELDFPMTSGVRSDNGLVCLKGDETVLMDENTGEILATSKISTDVFMAKAILGNSCYGLCLADNQWVPTYISAEDFWKGDVTKVIPFMSK